MKQQNDGSVEWTDALELSNLLPEWIKIITSEQHVVLFQWVLEISWGCDKVMAFTKAITLYNHNIAITIILFARTHCYDDIINQFMNALIFVYLV